MRLPARLFLAIGLLVVPVRAIGMPGEASAVPCDTCLPGVTNFARLDNGLWRGAQPTAAGFKALKAAGVKTIVSLRHDQDDAPLLKGTGLRYLRIPSRAWRLREENLALFLKVMANPANQPVFVHCAEGRDRTGYNVAAYRMVVQGWNSDAAIGEMERFHFNKVWILNPGDLRRLDLSRLRERVKAVPEPTLVTVP
ncbi:fused DSP-PTPase phosphatase/NAD kinase-like protein [Holophaga foetida]|uniref:fused DSP-PTPase phosphatase/NAD kinase-like protein n=1 Tax=Holophaga foetida TaxID=35839 RepID=UPI0002473755|nr:tyrosine-protein phosphatase [Holophaga foetida]